MIEKSTGKTKKKRISEKLPKGVSNYPIRHFPEELREKVNIMSRVTGKPSYQIIIDAIAVATDRFERVMKDSGKDVFGCLPSRLRGIIPQ